MSETLMTVAEVAKYLSYSPTSISYMARRGKIPGVKVGKEWRFPKDVIDQWIQQRARASLSEPQAQDADLAPERAGLRTAAERKQQAAAGGDLTAYQRRVEEALRLAEELDPIVEAGTRGRVDASKDIHASRQGR